jgi:hypothetical protein
MDYERRTRSGSGRRTILIVLVAVAGSVAALVASLTLLALRNADYQRVLPSGYVLLRSNSLDTSILDTDSDELAVPPNIDGVALVPEARLIIGHTRASPVGPTKGGYFLIDTRTRTATVELTEAAWRAQLRTVLRGPTPRLKDPRDLAGKQRW